MRSRQMRERSSRRPQVGMRTWAIMALCSVAWVGVVAAQGIAPGQWIGGNPTDNNPFFICMNVSEDGQRLTAVGTQCTGNQGQNNDSININWQAGTLPDGTTQCNQYSYRGAAQGDLQIGADGSFTHTFSNAFVSTTITGTFDAAAGTASGTARTINVAVDCQVTWTAAPAAAPDPLPSPAPAEPTPPPAAGVQGITPGQWVGGSGTPTNSTPFYACLNVSEDGQRLTAVGTQCRGNQGQNQNSIDLQWQSGTFADGTPCNGNANRGLDLGDVQIAQDGTFQHTFSNFAVDVVVDGTFDAAAGMVSGTASVTTRWSPTCTIAWDAAPAGSPAPAQ